MATIRTRFFQSWFRMTRSMTLGVRAAVENERGEILMVKHTYIAGWHLPGGGVEKGEPAIQALTRELAEEGGVKLGGTPLLFGVYSNHKVFRNDHVLLYRVPPGFWTETEAQHGREIAESRWFDPLSPPDGTTPGTRRRLAELYQGRTSEPYW